jgi:putative copper export protein
VPALTQTLATSLDLLGLVLLGGVMAGWLWLQPRRPAGRAVAALDGWLALAVALSLAGAAADLLLRTAALHEIAPAAAWPHVGDVLLGSDYGRFWILRVASLLALVLLWAIARGATRPLRMAAPLVVLAGAFAIAGTGHAGEDGGLTVLALSGVVHVTAASLWGGSVIIYGFAIAPRLRHGLVPAAWVAESATRLSALAGLALAMVLASGLYNAWMLVGTIPAMWQTDYGRILMFKLALVAVMMGIGFFNRYQAVPLIRAWAQPPQLAAEADAPLARLQTMLRIDALVVLLVILAAAVLGNTSPAAHLQAG